MLAPISISPLNPLETDQGDYQCKLALPYNGNISSNNLGIYSEKIPGGNYAVIKYEGQRDIYGFLHAITFFLVDWLPHSGWNKMNDQILIEHLNSPLDVDETKLIIQKRLSQGCLQRDVSAELSGIHTKTLKQSLKL